jgi:nitrogen fixation-related uncharacterized protein
MKPDLGLIPPLVLLAIFGSAFLFGALAVLALTWAYANGQFANLGRSSRAIFDPDEPEGTVTDAFPNATARIAHGESKTDV